MGKRSGNFNKLKKQLEWRLLDTYILKKFLGSFFYSLALLMAIIVIFDVSDNIQRFLDNKVPFWTVVTGYYLNFIPYFINLFIPLFTFISVIWFTSKLSQQNEIVAMLSSGINFYRILLPYLTGALIIAVLAFFMANYVNPYTNNNLNKFKQEHFKRRIGANSNIHVKTSSDTYIFVRRWDKMKKTGDDFTYEKLGDETINYKIKASKLTYDEENDRWILEDYMKRRIVDGREIIEWGDVMDTTFNITPDNLNKDVTVVGTMTFGTLQQYIKEEREKGSNFVKYYLIEKNKRIANPLGTIIMTLLGLSVSSRKNHRGVGVHLFFGVALAFIFIFLQQISDVFAISGGIPPAIGAWIPNIIYLVLCIFMLRSTPK